MRSLLAKRCSVAELSKRVRSTPIDFDAARFQEAVSTEHGRPVELRYRPGDRTGTITLTWHSREDLEAILEGLGCHKDPDF